jgi:hypothetical protein
MPTSTADIAGTAALKAQLEAFAGHDIVESPDHVAEQLRNFTSPVGNYDLSIEGKGRSLTKSTFAFPPFRKCSFGNLLDIGGGDLNTSADGTVEFFISDYLCTDFDAGLTYDEPVNIVATPVTVIPCFLTMNYLLIYDPTSNHYTNLRITVSAWDAKGAPAPNVHFHWRCRLPVGVFTG